MTSDAIQYHESLAAGWSGRYASGGMKRRAEFFQTDILPRLAPAGDWLDLGCGSGVFSRMLAARGANVLGLDGAPAMVEAAKAATEGQGARFAVGRVEDVTVLDQNFDGAICLSVIEYLDHPERALSALAARLKSRGRLGLSAPNRYSTLRLAQRALRPVAEIAGAKALAYMDSSRHLWTRGELARLVKSAGFEVEAILGFDPVAPRSLWPVISPSLWFVVAHRAW